MNTLSTAAIVIYLFALVAILLMELIGYWKTFEKMGESGWKALIPIYNGYLMYKRTWVAKMYWIMFALTIANSLIMEFGNSISASYIVWAFITFAISTVITIIQSDKLSRAFGHGHWFTVGLVLLGPIFIMILGFGSSEFTDCVCGSKEISKIQTKKE